MQDNVKKQTANTNKEKGKKVYERPKLLYEGKWSGMTLQFSVDMGG